MPRLLGRPELAGPPHIPAGLPPEAFLGNLASDGLRAALAEAFAAAEAGGLEAALNAAGVPAAKVRDLGAYLREVYPDTPGIGVAGEPLAFGPAFRWTEGGDPPEPVAVPELGADTAALAGEGRRD